MSVETLQCPKCGASNPQSLGKYMYRCTYCDSRYHFISSSQVIDHIKLIQQGNSCTQCGETQLLRVCFFCRRTFCRSHCSEVRDHEFFICKSCSRDNLGKRFLKVQKDIIAIRRKIKDDRQLAARLESDAEREAAADVERYNTRRIIHTAGIGGIVGFTVLLIGINAGGFRFMYGILMMLILVPLGGMIGKIRGDQQKEASHRNFAVKRMQENRKQITDYNNEILVLRDKLRLAENDEKEIIAELMT